MVEGFREVSETMPWTFKQKPEGSLMQSANGHEVTEASHITIELQFSVCGPEPPNSQTLNPSRYLNPTP